MKDNNTPEWLVGAPAIVRFMAQRFPPDICVRMTTNTGHYDIVSYGDNGTMCLAHGSDSFDPGVVVAGVSPDDVVSCGCGKWEPPTQAQMKAKQREVDLLNLHRAMVRPSTGN